VAVGLAALGLFVWRELVVLDPVLELRVFRARDFTLAILTQWAGFGAIFGTFFLVPLFLQEVRGYGAFETGLFTLPQALAAALFMQLSGRAYDRFGARPPVLVGLTMVAFAMWLLSGLRGNTSGEDLRLPLFLLGGGMGTMMMALNTHILSTAPRELVGRVTSLTQALQNVVGSLAIASFATILQARVPVRLAEISGADGMAFAFGDVYRGALVIVVVGWFLVWTLRRIPMTAEAPQPAVGTQRAEREPALAGG
jgi:MFS family permease